MNAERIIKAAIPNAPDFVMEHIIWGRTPYPFAALTPKSLYKAAYSYSRACVNGLTLCDFCHRLATEDKCLCDKCRAALRKHG